MHARFISSGPFIPGSTIELTGDEFHHAARVTRVRVGETVELLDGAGAMAEAVVATVGKRCIGLRVERIIEAGREPPLWIELAIALIQPDRFELVLQKGTELGVARFTPLITERGETRPERAERKHDRWVKILVEATKQCGRAIVPDLAGPEPFREVLSRANPRILFDADAGERCASEEDRARVTLLIGPEGGWTENEIAAARAAGCEIRRLGPRRLRAETAAIAAATMAGMLWGDLAGES